MKQFILFLVLTLPTAVAAQELHTFSNGGVADAEKINENFQYVLENATGSGGCSAEQDGSTVVITCADGTSGVLASEGTVVAVLKAVAGELLDYETLPTGDIVVIDSDDNILGKVQRNGDGGWFIITVEVDTTSIELGLWNNDADSSVIASGVDLSLYLYYTAPECTSEPVGSNTTVSRLYDIDRSLYVASETVDGQTLFYGKRQTGYINQYGNGYIATGDCIEIEEARSDYVLLSRLVLPDEVTEAVYPLRLKQLP